MAGIFREQLQTVIQRSGLSQTQFAKALKIDRCSLVQLLTGKADRLPRVETLAAIADFANVSFEWLLGLKQSEQADHAPLPEVVRIEHNALSPVDERVMKWHRDAAGYKIRTVPLTFPDPLKTAEVIDFEYRRSLKLDSREAVESVRSGLAFLRRPEADVEVSSSVQLITAFAHGQGDWRGLAAVHRRNQLNHLIDLCEELYPSFRWVLFDEKQVFSVPLTIFGPLRAALHTGQGYIVFNTSEHVQALARHFDNLVRKAIVQPSNVPDYLRNLLSQLEPD